MLNNYAENGGGFSNSHGQTTRSTTEGQKQQNISSTWGYNSQLEGMYYGTDPQAMFVGPYEGSTKHPNYTQYPAGTIHQPVPAPVVKCHEVCCQHYPDHRYPINPAPLRYQPSGTVQPRYAELSANDSRQFFTERRTLSRKKAYPTENGYPNISDRHFSQYMARGQMHMADPRQIMRTQYPMYPPYWGGPRGWGGPRMNCPPPPYHQSMNQGAQLQSGLKITDGSHLVDQTSQKSVNAQHRRGIVTSGGGTEIIRPVPEPKRPSINPNLPSYDFSYSTGFVPFSEINKGGSLKSGNSSACKIPNEKQYLPHQMQFPMQNADRNLMNCSNPINDIGYPLNFPMTGNEAYIRSGLDDGQQIPDAHKMPLHYEPSLSKKRPDLDLRQYLATWEDDEDEGSRLSEPSINLGTSGAPYIVVDCRSLEDAVGKRFKTVPPQGCTSKSRSSSPNSNKRTNELPQQNAQNGADLNSEFHDQTTYANSMPSLLNESEKNAGFWNGTAREGENVIGKGGAFQPLDCTKRDVTVDPKRDSHPHNELTAPKLPGSNDTSNMSFDALVSFYGDNRRIVDGGYDFVEMTERLVNNSEKQITTNQHPEITRPLDPRLQQSQLSNNPSIYNKVTPRYPTSNYQHFKPNMPVDPYYNYKHQMASSKYFGFENPQIGIDPNNYDYHKIMSDFDAARLFGTKDQPKDPRRIGHPDLEKGLESAFIDQMRKSQIPDCYQDKHNLEFEAVDADQFMGPLVMKKTEMDKNVSFKERLNENDNFPEKTVLITSQNGPPEIFRVPYSPEKELSNKDNIVTLHSGDQTKNNTITVEVPYVQQYSTLVKLSEEIDRSQKSERKSEGKIPEPKSSSKNTSTDEFKKPTSFKLKRVPNTKEWTVAHKTCEENSEELRNENDNTLAQNDLLSESNEEREALKSPVVVSNLNMPSLDDIIDGDKCNDVVPETNIDNDSTGSFCKDKNQNSTTKFNKNTQISQLVNINQTDSQNQDLGSTPNPNLHNINKDDAAQNIHQSTDSVDTTENIITDSTQLSLIPENKISKHNNFRSHKKIQSFSNNIPNCLSSPNEEYLNPQDLNPENVKETFSPFHVYSDCDMNSHISDYFKLDERTASEKILDARMPTSPGVEAMFEDINSSNTNQLYQSKSCDFQDFTDPNISHNGDFQSFSNIFPEESDRGERSDGSVLQMNDKSLHHIFDHIDNQQVIQSLEKEESNGSDTHLEGNKDISSVTRERKTSPPIPPISLKLNEANKIWCIARKEEERLSEQNTPVDESVSKKPDTFENNFFNKESSDTSMSYFENRVNEVNIVLDKQQNHIGNKSPDRTQENEHNYCIDKENKSILNQLIFTRGKGDHENHSLTKNAIKNQMLDQKESLPTENVIIQDKSVPTFSNEICCLSVMKLYPKPMIFRRIKSLGAPKSVSDSPLIFDEQGKHYPKSNNTQRYESECDKLIVQDVVEYLINQSIIMSNLTVEETMDCTDSNLFEHNHSSVDNVRVEETNPQWQSVIKFDGSSNQRDSNIAKTTELFIQKEQENIEHHSVIRTVTSEESGCNYTDIKKTFRSIFSPMSDINEEESSITDPSSNIPEMVVLKDNHTQIMDSKCSIEKDTINIVLSKDIITGFHDYNLDKTVISQNENNFKSVIEEDIRDDHVNTHNKDDKNTALSPNREEGMRRRKNLEIDDALELMGLSIDKIEKQNISEIGKEKTEKWSSERQNKELQEALESNDHVEQLCDQLRTRDNNSNGIERSSLEQIKEIKEENKICSQSESSTITIHTLDTNSDKRTLAEEKSSRITNIYASLAKDTLHEQNGDLNHSPGKHLLYSAVITSERSDIFESENVHGQITNNSKSFKRLGSEFESIEALISKDSKTITKTDESIPPASELVCSTTVDETFSCNKLTTESYITCGFDCRPETSVIVRNNSSNSIGISHVKNIASSPYELTSQPIFSSQTPHQIIGAFDYVVNQSFIPESAEENLNNDTFKADVQGPLRNTDNNDDIVDCSVSQAKVSCLNPIDNEQNHSDSIMSDLSNEMTRNPFEEEENADQHFNETHECVPNEIGLIKSWNLYAGMPYCVSELMFLCSPDFETTDVLNGINPNYFYHFKRSKWHKFSKRPMTRQRMILSDFKTPQKPYQGNPNIIDIQIPEIGSLGNQYENVTDNNECFNQNSFVMHSDNTNESSLMKDSPFLEENLSDKLLILKNQSENIIASKILEPEAILKEIFSPDSEVGCSVHLELSKPESILNIDSTMRLDNHPISKNNKTLSKLGNSKSNRDSNLSGSDILNILTQENENVKTCSVTSSYRENSNTKLESLNLNNIFLTEDHNSYNKNSIQKSGNEVLFNEYTNSVENQIFDQQSKTDWDKTVIPIPADSFYYKQDSPDCSNFLETSTVNTNSLIKSAEFEVIKQHIVVTGIPPSKSKIMDILPEDCQCSVKVLEKEQKISQNLANEFEFTDDVSFVTSNSGRKTLDDFDTNVNTTQQDTDKENFEIMSGDDADEMEKGLLLSKEILQNGFNDCRSSNSSFSNSLKSFLKRSKQNFSKSQKRNVNSVQDSLNINQHLNQETFPLQCLVEAALALENVDSKQNSITDTNLSNISFQKKDDSEKHSQSNTSQVQMFCNENNMNTDRRSHNKLTPDDKEIFSKYEETNYNFRASTRIVTSSSSNIIPYPKRKYCFKSKLSSASGENMKEKSESSTDKCRAKKRRGCFAYARSKKRRKIIKEKQKSENLIVFESKANDSDKTDSKKSDLISTESQELNACHLIRVEQENNIDNMEPKSHENCFDNELENLNPNNGTHERKDSSQTGFGGPLLFANDDKTDHRKIFCVNVNSDKVDDYENNINLEDLEILSENNHTSYDNKENINDADVSNVTLETGTSLVIIIEELDHLDKRNFSDVIKGDSNIILGSIESNSPVSCFQQSHPLLDDCSDILNTDLSVNESFNSPSEFVMNSLLKEQPYETLGSDSLISKTGFEENDGIEDDFRKYSEEVLPTNCYDDMNTNLVSDIGNWPFVEEEVAEFDIEPELPNKIPEEGRKIELKCSLPWKKIFNMSKNKKKKSRAPRKISGLELGPAKVEVRLRAPSAEWQVISDYHDNKSPVVKVKRLILQRDSDVSSYSEKDSEEENDVKKQLMKLSGEADLNADMQVAVSTMEKSEKWQPVVLLTRNKKLDELTLSLDGKVCSQNDISLHSKAYDSETKTCDNSLDSSSNSESSESGDDDISENHTVFESAVSASCIGKVTHFSQYSEHDVSLKSGNVAKYECGYSSSKTSKSQEYETYSPSGDNALSIEAVYSPSDPHYSPEMFNQESQCRLLCEDNNSDLFNNNVPRNEENSNQHSGSLIKTSNTIKEKEYETKHPAGVIHPPNQVGTEIENFQGIDKFNTNLVVASQYNSFYDNVYDPILSSNPKTEISTFRGEDAEVHEVSKLTPKSGEHSSIILQDEYINVHPSLKIESETKKHTRRKMPKNFFVRKKCRKPHIENCLSNDVSHHDALPDNLTLTHLPASSTLVKRQDSVDSISTVESYHSGSPSRKSSSSDDDHFDSESIIGNLNKNPRLQCDEDNEGTSPLRLNETPVIKRFEEKQRLRDGGRGIKRPCEGHSKEDTKRRRKHSRIDSSRCVECQTPFVNKVSNGLIIKLNITSFKYNLVQFYKFSTQLVSINLKKNAFVKKSEEITYFGFT